MVYRNIKALLIKNGISRIEFAKSLKIDPSTLSMKINGKRDFTKTEIDKIIDIFQLPYEEIFFIDEINKTLNQSA